VPIGVQDKKPQHSRNKENINNRKCFLVTLSPTSCLIYYKTDHLFQVDKYESIKFYKLITKMETLI